MELIGRIVAVRINVNLNGMEIVAIQKILLPHLIVHQHQSLNEEYSYTILFFNILNKLENLFK